MSPQCTRLKKAHCEYVPRLWLGETVISMKCTGLLEHPLCRRVAVSWDYVLRWLISLLFYIWCGFVLAKGKSHETVGSRKPEDSVSRIPIFRVRGSRLSHTKCERHETTWNLKINVAYEMINERSPYWASDSKKSCSKSRELHLWKFAIPWLVRGRPFKKSVFGYSAFLTLAGLKGIWRKASQKMKRTYSPIWLTFFLFLREISPFNANDAYLRRSSGLFLFA